MLKKHKVLIWHTLSFLLYRNEARPFLKLLDKSFIDSDWCQPEMLTKLQGALNMFSRKLRSVAATETNLITKLEDFTLRVIWNLTSKPDLQQISRAHISQLVFSRSPTDLSATQNNRLLESLASVIILIGRHLTCIEFHEVEIVLANLTTPKRKPTQLSQAIIDYCSKLQSIKFSSVYSLHLVWDLLLQSQVKLNLNSLALSQGKCL